MGYTEKELRLMARRSPPSAPCPFSDPCHICHIGFMIPVDYKTDEGKRYLYENVKPLVKKLDPKTVMARIHNHEDNVAAYFFNPFDKH
jgi:hypothetical protein